MAQDSVKINMEIATEAAKKALDGMKAKAGETSQAFAVFQGTFAGGAALAGISALGSIIGSTFSAAVQEARNASKEVSDLNIALANAGNYSAETSKKFQDFADSIEATTMYSGGAVMENTALLQSMTNLSEDGLMRGQKAAIELAAAYNLDLGTATQAIAKAHNGQTGALKKLGLQFDETRSDAQNYENILGEIEKKNGTAAAKGATFEGAMARIENGTNKVLEAFGNLIVKNPLVAKGLSAISDGLVSFAGIVENAVNWLNQNTEILELFAVGLGSAVLGLVAFGTYTALASGGLAILKVAALAAWGAVTAPVTLVIAAVAAVGVAIYAIVKYWDDVKAAAYNALAATLEFASKGAAAIGATEKAKGLQELADKYRGLAVVAKEAAEAERAESNKSTETVVNNNKAVRAEMSETQKQRLKEIDDFTAKLAKQAEDEKFFNDLKLENQSLYNEQKNTLEEESDTVSYEARLEREIAYHEMRQEFLDEQYMVDLARIDASRLAEEDKIKAMTALDAKYKTDSLKAQVDFNKKKVDFDKKAKDEKDKMDKANLQATSDLFGAMAAAAELGGRDMFNVMKAFQLAQAITAGYLAVQQAFANAPGYPANVIAATAAGIAAAVNVAKIASAQPPAFAQGGIVPGTSYSGDKVLARLNSDEMVFNKNQQKNLWNAANSGNMGSGDTLNVLSQILEAVQSGTSINIDGREIISVVRDGMASGRTLGSLG